jgi:hypothetical protein
MQERREVTGISVGGMNVVIHMYTRSAIHHREEENVLSLDKELFGFLK